MKISKNKVVTMHYTLKDDSGNTLDTSEGKDPLSFIHGIGHIIPGLEKALEEKVKGDSLDVVVEPEDGYGSFNEELVFSVPKTQFPDPDELTPGMQFQADTGQGQHIFQVVKIEDDSIVINGNHPLAGVTLHFAVTICDVREATEQELEHGHVH